mmetsp:Transcript_46606/g.110832  ORF Transcript_46606/g.110832 Transcript_46606/m.110832 type:complete len:225 (-) Transcript_46606:477-1151(-)
MIWRMSSGSRRAMSRCSGGHSVVPAPLRLAASAAAAAAGGCGSRPRAWLLFPSPPSGAVALDTVRAPLVGAERRCAGGASFEGAVAGTLPPMGAPASNSFPMMRTFPRWAARCRGVQPRLSATAGSALRARRPPTMFRFSRSTAWCRAVRPRAPAALISRSSLSHKSLIISICSAAAAASTGGRGCPGAAFTQALLWSSSLRTSPEPESMARLTALQDVAAAPS